MPRPGDGRRPLRGDNQDENVATIRMRTGGARRWGAGMICSWSASCPPRSSRPWIDTAPERSRGRATGCGRRVHGPGGAGLSAFHHRRERRTPTRTTNGSLAADPVRGNGGSAGWGRRTSGHRPMIEPWWRRPAAPVMRRLLHPGRLHRRARKMAQGLRGSGHGSNSLRGWQGAGSSRAAHGERRRSGQTASPLDWRWDSVRGPRCPGMRGRPHFSHIGAAAFGRAVGPAGTSPPAMRDRQTSVPRDVQSPPSPPYPRDELVERFQVVPRPPHRAG